jgi:hypothetical protein
VATAKKNTASPTPAADERAAHAERVQQSEGKLVEKRHVRQNREADLADLNTAAAAALAAWGAGDESVPADAHPDPMILKRMEALLAAAMREEERAKSALVCDDVRLAELLASAVEELLHVAPTVLPYVPSVMPDAPAAVLVQTSATKFDGLTGAASGAVELFWTRPAYAVSVDTAELSKLCDRHGVKVNRAQGLNDDGTTERVSISVVSAYGATTPVIQVTDPESQARSLALDVRDDFAGRHVVMVDTSRTRHPGFDSPSVNVLLGSIEDYGVTSDQRRGGERLITIEATFKAELNNSVEHKIGITDAREAVERSIQDQLGRVVPGLGRIKSAEAIGGNVLERSFTSGRTGEEVIRPFGAAVRGRFVAVSIAAPEQPATAMDEGEDELVPSRRPAVDPRDREPSHPGRTR